jgi:hypothetical protein
MKNVKGLNKHAAAKSKTVHPTLDNPRRAVPKKRRLRSRKVVHIGRPRNAFYHVRVFYDGGLDQKFDEALFCEASTKWVCTSRSRRPRYKKVLRYSDSSGCCMFPPYTRDHEWDFVKIEDARACYKRLKALLFSKHNHQMPKRRIELWDEKPRLVSLESDKARRMGTLKNPVPGGAPALRRNRRAA